jgi:hypothetical protein
MQSIAYELAKYLEAQSAGTFGEAAGDAWSIFVGEEPALPDSTITLYDAGGGEPFVDIDLRQPVIQVRVRGRTYMSAYAKQVEIMHILAALVQEAYLESYFIGVWQTTDVFPLGRDDNDRVRLVVTYRVERQSLEDAS